jgi:hypothetical protein
MTHWRRIMGKPTKELKIIHNWIGEQLKREDMPPWEWFDLMKLNEAINNTIEGPNPTRGYKPERSLNVVE